jgi:serine/threonine protein kinase
VFFDPTNGDIVICDNDNVTVDGERGGEEPGTPGFMAPEIVRGSALPSSRTDLYSLAVLLFLLFMLHHPLHGKREAEIKCLDDKAMGKLYGTEPVFIWHPTDMSNRPVRGYQDNAIVYWSIYPAFLRELFTKAFTGGLFNPDERIRESEWRQAMVTLRDSIFYCSCGKMNFYDGEELKRTGSVPGNCWACKKQLKLPPRIRIDKNLIMLNHDTQLFPHHIDRDKMWDFSRPVACITKHPSNPKIWGIKNLTNEKWVATLSDGTIKDVEPERSVSLQAGAKLNFGKSEGEIRV